MAGNTVGDAVAACDCTQPMLFQFQERLWINLDHSAVPVTTSCTPHAFVLLLQYYTELCIFSLFEKVLRLKPIIGRSVVLADFCQQVLQ